MKNLIYICVFNNPKYVEMLYLLLDSLYLFGKVEKNNIDILIYTSTEFKNMIENSIYHKPNIKYATNDTYTTIDKACKSRIDLFEILINLDEEYNKILYLDTDVLVQGDLAPIFEAVEEDKIYAMEEGRGIHTDPIFWGRDLYVNRNQPVPTTPGFSSGVMIFPNSATIYQLFNIIKEHMNHEYGKFHDQPFFVYHSTNRGLINKTRLVPQITTKFSNSMNNPANIIVHFAGNLGVHLYKLPIMTNYLNQLKTNLLKKFREDDNLENIIDQIF
jgi:lipopolysaccharide biosynthesis glycosyltransferase